MKSDIEHLDKVSDGIVVSTDSTAYAEYMQKRKMAESNDSKIAGLQHQINNMNSQLSNITSLLEKLVKG